MIGFPRTINEKAARVVAGVVALAGLVALLAPAHWLVIPLAYGFWARVLTGPRLSPLAALASRVIAPRLGPPRDVSGPPKRFAQGMGAAITTAAVVAYALGATGVVEGLLVLLVAAASLEVGARVLPRLPGVRRADARRRRARRRSARSAATSGRAARPARAGEHQLPLAVALEAAAHAAPSPFDRLAAQRALRGLLDDARIAQRRLEALVVALPDPLGDHHRRHAVADAVRERAALAHDPVDPDHERDADGDRLGA